MTLRVLASKAPTVCELWWLYSLAVNAHVGFPQNDLDEYELASLRSSLEDAMEAALEIPAPFLEFMETVEE